MSPRLPSLKRYTEMRPAAQLPSALGNPMAKAEGLSSVQLASPRSAAHSAANGVKKCVFFGENPELKNRHTGTEGHSNAA